MTATATEVQVAKAVKVTNAACPRCEGPMYFDSEKWLHGPTCRQAKLGTANKPIPLRRRSDPNTTTHDEDTMKATKGKAARAEKSAEADALFGRFMLTLGREVHGVQRLKLDPEFRPIAMPCDDLSAVLNALDDHMVAADEPLLTAYAASRRTFLGRLTRSKSSVQIQ